MLQHEFHVWFRAGGKTFLRIETDQAAADQRAAKLRERHVHVFRVCDFVRLQ